MVRKAMGRPIRLALAAAILLSSASPRAQPVADFYRGKTLRMLIGYGPGGGYDIYGRLVAEFLPRHLPGNPTIVTQNMPGAGASWRRNTCTTSRPRTAPCSRASPRPWRSTA
jgi:tripartite-type tricarboxylate transporter receptor subunit TctC